MATAEYPHIRCVVTYDNLSGANQAKRDASSYLSSSGWRMYHLVAHATKETPEGTVVTDTYDLGAYEKGALELKLKNLPTGIRGSIEITRVLER